MKPSRIVLYGAAIGAVGWSGWIVASRPHAAASVAPAAPRSVQSAQVAVAAMSGSAASDSTAVQRTARAGALPRRSALVPEPGGDSFAARSWVPPPAPAPPAPKVVAAPPPPPAPPPAPPLPVLPFKLVGLMESGANAKPQVFLAIQDRLLVASPGDVLDGGFRLDSVTARELSFTHLSSNVTLKLSVTGAPS